MKERPLLSEAAIRGLEELTDLLRPWKFPQILEPTLADLTRRAILNEIIALSEYEIQWQKNPSA